MSWVTPHRDGAVLTVRVIPRAARDDIQGEHNGALKVRLKAPPVDGKANKALLAFMARKLGHPRRNLCLVSGETGRHKRLLVSGITPEQVQQRLL